MAERAESEYQFRAQRPAPVIDPQVFPMPAPAQQDMRDFLRSAPTAPVQTPPRPLRGAGQLGSPDYLGLVELQQLQQAYDWRVVNVARYVCADDSVLYLIAATWQHGHQHVEQPEQARFVHSALLTHIPALSRALTAWARRSIAAAFPRNRWPGEDTQSGLRPASQPARRDIDW